MREEIKVELRALADELGPKMPFWNDRIITEEHFQHSQGSTGPPSRVSYVKKDKKK